MHRFDHHRHPLAKPARDRARGVLYAARTLSGCVVDVFGDAGAVVPGDKEVAELEVTHNLTLLELRGVGAMRAGSVAALASTADRGLSQAWSRYFFEHWRENGAVDGLIYFNAHNGEDTILLYQRARTKIVLGPHGSMRLDDAALEPYLQRIALQHNLLPPP